MDLNENMAALSVFRIPLANKYRRIISECDEDRNINFKKANFSTVFLIGLTDAIATHIRSGCGSSLLRPQ